MSKHELVKKLGELVDTVADLRQGIDDNTTEICNSMPSTEDYSSEMKKIADYFSDKHQEEMGKQMTDYVEKIESAINLKNELGIQVSKVVKQITEFGSADISKLDRRMIYRLRRKYPVCSKSFYHDDEERRTCSRCEETIFANSDILNMHVTVASNDTDDDTDSSDNGVKKRKHQ